MYGLRGANTIPASSSTSAPTAGRSRPSSGSPRRLGAWTLELVPGVTFFSDNTNFLDGHTRTQDPIYSVQVHVIYGFQSGVWVALNGTYFAGGRTSIDDVPGDDRLVELAGRTDRRLAGRPEQLGQVLREQRRVHAHRQQLQYLRPCLAVPLGW